MKRRPSISAINTPPDGTRLKHGATRAMKDLIIRLFLSSGDCGAVGAVKLKGSASLADPIKHFGKRPHLRMNSIAIALRLVGLREPIFAEKKFRQSVGSLFHRTVEKDAQAGSRQFATRFRRIGYHRDYRFAHADKVGHLGSIRPPSGSRAGQQHSRGGL